MTPSTAAASSPAPAAGFFRAATSSSQVVNGTRGERSTRSSLSRDKTLQARATLGERPLAQILGAVGEQIVGAQMSREFREQLRRDGFAVEPLLQHVERLHPALAHDQ